MSAPVEFPAAARRLIAGRDADRCARCGRPLRQGANAHHRKLRSRGGRGTPANGVLLCGSGTTGCHGWAHGNVKDATEAGLIVASWDDPAEVPMLTWRGWMTVDENGGYDLAA